MIGIFGGAGFIGRNLSDLLSKNNEAFLSFDRTLTPAHKNQSILIDYHNPDTYRQHLKALDSIVMLISTSTPSTYAKDISLEVEKNILPFSNLLKYASKEDIKNIIFFSSGGTVYGRPQTSPTLETHPTLPENNYGCAKLMMENIFNSMARQHDWQATVFRPSNPIGRYQKPGAQGIVSAAVGACLTNKPLDIWGDGSVIRDYFDVEDLTDAIYIALKDPNIKGCFNVSSNIGRSIRDVINEVQEVLGKKITITYGEARPFDIPKNILSYDKLHKLSGWQPKRTFAYSIQQIAKTLT